MRWEVVISDGPEAGRKFQIPTDRPLVIGRGTQSDTRLNSPDISRIHCRVYLQDGHLILEDAGSLRGTRYRGNTIDAPVRLGPGDEFSLGPVLLRVESDNPLDAATVMQPTSESHLPAIKPPHGSLAGQEIHGFTVHDIAAVGKTSTVYRATHLSSGRSIAFKVLHPQFTSTDDQRERFVRAMRIVLPIEHPNIVRVLNAGRKGRICWSAMEWIDGIGVDALIERIGTAGAMDWRDVWRVAVHVCRALEEAHRRKIIHRNITPSNILRRDQDKVYLLTDLCLAKALESTDAVQLTRPGDALGELPYMAPEILKNPKLVDQRVDFYGLGATLYALLVGSAPFNASTVAELLDKLRAESGPTPARFRRPGINEDFEEVILKLAQINPDRRYDLPKQILRDLHEIGRRQGLEADHNLFA